MRGLVFGCGLLCAWVTFFLGTTSIAHAASYPEFCADFTRELELGDEGDDVRELQKVYNAEGYGPIPETGFYGRMTAQATKKFQKQRDILETGNVGPVTFTAMRAAWCLGGAGESSESSPLLFFGASPPDGGTVYVYWISRNVSSCMLDGRTVAPSGIERATPGTHTLVCSSAQGALVRTVNVTHPTTPSQPQNVGTPIPASSLQNFVGTVQGSQATLEWSSIAMASCQLSGGGIEVQVPVTGSRVVELPSSGATYRLTCTGNDHQKHTRTVSLVPSSTQVPPPTPTPPPTPNATVTPFFRAEPSTIQSGGSSILSWQGPEHSTCKLTGGVYSNSTFDLAGSVAVTPTVSTTYTLVCTVVDQILGTKEAYRAAATVTVFSSSSTSGESFFRSDKTSVTLGESVTLSWSAPNASYCSLPVATQTIGARLGPNGTHALTPSRTPESTYRINCFSASGAVLYTADVVIRVTPTTSSFISNFPIVQQGNYVMLSWTVPNAQSCSIHASATTAAHTWSVLENGPGQGATSAAVAMPAQFILTCKNSLGHQFITKTVSVNVEYPQS